VPGLYREFESGKALRLAIEIAEDFNLYVTEAAPWKLATSDPERARAVCTAGMHASKIIAAILAPVLPAWAEKTRAYAEAAGAVGSSERGADPLPAGLLWASTRRWRSRSIRRSWRRSSRPAARARPLAAEASIEAFAAVDLRVGAVLACEAVAGSNKLLRLTIDLGPLGQRTIFSGIALSYSPDALVGKRVVVFANLKPRKMRFGVSEGMVLAAGAADDSITVLELDPRSRPGDKIT
jgi:methionyl-tRNA synthetase